MAKTPFFFREEKNQVYYHDFKIYIFGTDVTPWITSQVSLVKADRDGINSLSFSLSNAYQAFEMTGENLGISDPNTFYDDMGDPTVRSSASGSNQRSGKFRLTDPYHINGRYSELAKAKIYNLKKQIKGSSRNVKFQVQSLGPGLGGGTGKIHKIKNENSNNTTSEVTDRYPMSLGSLIFHKYDPVRFFVKNPLTRSDDEWVCEFTGYLDTKPYSQNFTTGESIINITCQDIRLLMQHMRVQTNPVSQIGNENIAFFGTKASGVQDPVPLDSGLFNDFVQYTGFSHVLGSLSWLGSVKFLLFGVPTAGGGRRGAIGKFKEGLTYYYNVNDSKKSDLLEKWNNIVNFGVTPIAVKEDVAPLVPEGAEDADPSKFEMFPSSNSQSKMEPGGFLTKIQMLALGTATVPDQAGSPDAGKVHFLLPAEGTPLQNMIEYNVIPLEPGVRVEFQSRLELLNMVCKILDYQFYVNGMGDFIVEFPMYDFQPTDYNEAYNSLYTFYNHIISDNINDEGGSPVTALEVTSTQLVAPLKNESNEVNGTQVGLDTELRHTVFSSVMASRFGPIVESYSVPGVMSAPQLVQLAYVEFNKRLANFSGFDFSVDYRPYVSVNRPMYHMRKQRFGISKSVTYVWRIHELATLEMSLQYVRKREGDSFRFISGGERQPISYRTIYDGIKVKGQGVDDTLEKNQKIKVKNDPQNPVNTKNKEGGYPH